MKSFMGKKTFLGDFASWAVLSVFVLFGRMLWVGGEYISGGFRGAWLTTLIAFAFGLLIFPFFAAISDLIFSREAKKSLPEKTVYLVLSLAVSLGAVYVMLSALGNGEKFVIDVMGINADKRLIAAALLLAAAFAAASGARAVKKLALIALAVSFISAVTLFLLSLSRGADLSESFNLMISDGAFADVSEAEGIKNAFLQVFAPCAVGVSWMSLTKERKENAGVAISNALCGLSVGAGTLVLCFLTVIFSQGLAYASTQKYPYISAVGSMTAGKLFMRPEGAVYFAYLAAIFTVLSVCISLLSRFLDGGRMKRTPYAVAAVIMAVYIFVG